MIGIIDYGAGNVASVAQTFERAGADPVIIKTIDHENLPDVQIFSHARLARAFAHPIASNQHPKLCKHAIKLRRFG